MFGLSVIVDSRFRKIEAAAEKAVPRLLHQNIEQLTKDARASINISPDPSAPGTPPHSRGGDKSLPAAMGFAVEGHEALSGPSASVVDQAGEFHEFGKSRGGHDFPVRDFMGPALERAMPRFAGSFAGSIGA